MDSLDKELQPSPNVTLRRFKIATEAMMMAESQRDKEAIDAEHINRWTEEMYKEFAKFQMDKNWKVDYPDASWNKDTVPKPKVPKAPRKPKVIKDLAELLDL